MILAIVVIVDDVVGIPRVVAHIAYRGRFCRGLQGQHAVGIPPVVYGPSAVGLIVVVPTELYAAGGLWRVGPVVYSVFIPYPYAETIVTTIAVAVEMNDGAILPACVRFAPVAGQ